MRLTKKKAIELSIELWEWLAETGKEKGGWPGWHTYGNISCGCFLCEYVGRSTDDDGIKCEKCPLKWGDYGCEYNPESYFAKWRDAETPGSRKKCARLFLAQLKELV